MRSDLRVALAGALATSCAIGLARFAYPPIFPVMVNQGWLTKGSAGVAGALNLAGYLSGVLAGRPVARRLSTPRTLDLGMALCVLAFAACAFDLGIAWFSAARYIAGVSGGILMAVAGPAVQAETPPAHRGRASGVTLAGIGAGAAVVALLTPGLLATGIRAAWLGMSALAFFSWALAFRFWPKSAIASTVREDTLPKASGGLIITYALSGSGITATFLYTVELAVRSRGMTGHIVTLSWALFGIGGALGSVYGGKLCDMLGGAVAIRLGAAIQLGALGLILVPSPLCHVFASFLLGLAGVGTVGCALAASREIAGASASLLWTRATAAYALSQAATAFILAAVFAHSGNGDHVFVISLLPTGLALLASLTLMEKRT